MRSRTIKFVLMTELATLPAWAYAQTVPADAAALPTQLAAAPSATQDAAQGAGIQDIVVTAQKRSENLQKIAAAVTSVTGDLITQRGITSLQVAQELVPGARFQQEGNSTQVFLRGVGSNLDFANVQPSVAFNFSGVSVPREGTSVGLYDVDRFEALPGPQGTLYGRSAIGGTINVSFNKPEFHNGGSVNVEAGNYDLAHGTVVGNLALSDTFAVRAAVDYNYHSGYFKTGSDSRSDLSGRLSTLWEPNSDVSVYWWGFTAQKYGSPPNSVNKGSRLIRDANGKLTGFAYDEDAFLNKNPFNDLLPPEIAAVAPFGQVRRSDQHYDNWATGAQINIKLGGGLTLIDIPAYYFLDAELKRYGLGAIPAYKQDEYNQFTNELRLAGDFSRFNFLAGLYLYHDVQSGKQIVGAETGPGGPSVPGTPFPFYSSHVLRNRLEGAAVFGQLTYNLADHLRLTAGGRYGIDKTNANGISLEDQTSPYAFDNTQRRFDYKIGAQYDLTSRIMIYSQFQTGYQPATFNEVVSRPNQSNKVGSATLDSFSAGIKTRFLNDTLQINDEIFYSIYHDLQIQAYNQSKLYNPIFNAKKVTIPGNQLDILWQPTRDDQASFSVSYIRNRNKDFVTPTGENYDGLAGPYAADWTISGGFHHDFQLSSGYVQAGADARYESRYWADFIHNPGTQQNPYAKVNAQLTYYSESGHWNVGLWGRNLSNKVTIAAAAATGLPGPATAFLAEPRTFGARAGYKF